MGVDLNFTAVTALIVTGVIASAFSQKCIEKCIIQDELNKSMMLECGTVLSHTGDGWPANIPVKNSTQRPKRPTDISAMIDLQNKTALNITVVYRPKRIKGLEGTLIYVDLDGFQPRQILVDLGDKDLVHIKGDLVINVVINLKCSGIAIEDKLRGSVSATSLPLSRRCFKKHRKCRTIDKSIEVHEKVTMETKRVECPDYEGVIENKTTPDSVDVEFCSTDIKNYYIDQVLLVCEQNPGVIYDKRIRQGTCNIRFDNVNFTCGEFRLEFSVYCSTDFFMIIVKQKNIQHLTGESSTDALSTNQRRFNPLVVLLPLSIVLGITTLVTFCIIFCISRHRRDFSAIRNCKDLSQAIIKQILKKNSSDDDNKPKDSSRRVLIISFVKDENAHLDCLTASFEAVGVSVVHPGSTTGNEAMQSYPDWLEHIVASCDHYIFLVCKSMYEQLESKHCPSLRESGSHLTGSYLYAFNLIRQEFEKGRSCKKQCHLVALGSENEEYMNKLSRLPFFYINEAVRYNIFYQPTGMPSPKAQFDDFVSFTEMEKLICNVKAKRFKNMKRKTTKKKYPTEKDYNADKRILTTSESEIQ